MGVQSSNASYYIHNGVNTGGFPLNTKQKNKSILNITCERSHLFP